MTGTAPVTEPHELLAESAPLAWQHAPTSCRRDPATGETCAWYHGVWQYLRVLGVISSTQSDGAFLLRTFRECARDGRHPRALVSGTADYSMLAHLRLAYAMEQAELDATVVDRCPTSLLLNGWYGERHDMRLTTVASEFLEFDSAETFDVVCTHSFLGFFDEEARPRLVRRWQQLLRPGGCVITAQRVRPGTARLRTGFSDAEALRLREQVAAAARAYPGVLGPAPEALSAAAHEYARRAGTHVITSSASLVALFEAEGFEVTVDHAAAAGSERDADRASTSADAESYRIRLVARKR